MDKRPVDTRRRHLRAGGKRKGRLGWGGRRGQGGRLAGVGAVPSRGPVAHEGLLSTVGG